jgi:glycosyltransferase involved in cell wall biosynthesis
MEQAKDSLTSWTQIESLEKHYHDYEFPKITIVIPTFNCSQSISTTIESVLMQDYPAFEIIVIDAESADRTVEVIKRFRDDRIALYSVSDYHRYEMMNKGIAQAQGEYINFLFPGDFYLSRFTFKLMMTLALDTKKPDLVYCGALLRDGKSEVKILSRQLNLQLLKRGQQPTSLQSCWFKKESLNGIGKFAVGYVLRGGFDLMCRFCMQPMFKAASTTRILTDYDLRWVSKRMVIRHFWETMRTVYHYFGAGTVIRWLFVQKDVSRFLKLWIRSAKIAFTGR